MLVEFEDVATHGHKYTSISIEFIACHHVFAGTKITLAVQSAKPTGMSVQAFTEATLPLSELNSHLIQSDRRRTGRASSPALGARPPCFGLVALNIA